MSGHAAIPPRLNEISRKIVQAAYTVHSELGPGLLESVYRACLAQELLAYGLSFRQEVALPIVYREIKLEAGLRLDFLVEELVIIEVKAVEALHPVHDAQLLSYLKLSERRLGLLLNFNVALMKEGIRRLVR